MRIEQTFFQITDMLDAISQGQKGGNLLPTVAVRWHHMFSVTSQ